MVICLKASQSVWASRFFGATIIQGLLATALTLFFVIGQISYLQPAVSRIIASGNAGTWFTVGYTTYLIVGVVGVAVAALIYYYLEAGLGKVYTGVAKIFAWTHLIFLNVGVIGATWMLMIGGYLGGGAMQPVEAGGLGWNPGQVHANIFYGIPMGYPLWITAFVIILGAGVLLGAVGYLITWTRKT